MSLDEKKIEVVERGKKSKWTYPEEDLKQSIKELKEKDKLKFPLGCEVIMRNRTTSCGDISFANKIILCDNCTRKLLDKFEENEKNKVEIFGEGLI